jgi:hypothetical protein
LQAAPAQDVLPTRIHRGNMFVSGEAWRFFKEAHPEQDFSDFWLCFDLSSFFLLREDESHIASNSSSSKIVKTEPLSPITTGLDFAYASDIVENNSRKPEYVVELSF